MPFHTSLAQYDPLVTITDHSLVQRFGDTVLVGSWFVFFTPEWFLRLDMAQQVATATSNELSPRSPILFRGKDITLQGVKLASKQVPQASLISLTCDKSLYRLRQDTVRLLIAAPHMPNTPLTLSLSLGGNSYATYPITVDEHGLYLWSMRDLPEGEYVVTVQGMDTDACRFEVAEYRLAPLNVELVEQQLTGNTLRYVLSITAFGQPYTDSVTVELQVQGRRIGERTTLRCNREGQCRGAVKLTEEGLHTLNIIAGERTATVVLKGSEQQRREALTISELGELRLISLLPSPQSNACRGMYISRGGANTEPFLVRRVIGNEVEITARTPIDHARIVVTNPTRGTAVEQHYEQIKAEQSIRLPIPQPYGVVLIGAFVDGRAWEGWCAILRPSDIQLQCEAPKEAKPGSSITITLKTGRLDRDVPIQLIVKDQRLTAQSDPQVELAARIKKHLSEWYEQTGTGTIERTLSSMQPFLQPRFRRSVGGAPMVYAALATTVNMQMPMAAPIGAPISRMPSVVDPEHTPEATLTKIRMQFPEIVYNNIVKVRGETKVEVKLGESMTRYSIEAFALSSETMDWQRAETIVDAVQPVYGELTVSPFVFPGDPVLGRLDVGAASGGAIAEVRHDGELLPLFFADGSEVTPGIPMPSGSVVRFPVRPGTITAMVRDARKGGVDVSERFVTEPGTLRHITRRLHLLNPGDEVSLDALQALELQPMPGLERPFQFFVESATQYPYGCIEQTSTKLYAMFVGYITNQENSEQAREYEAAILAWYKRLKSMYLPTSGFCFYPPEEGGEKKPDTYYAPLAVKRLLSLPTAERTHVQASSLVEILDDIHMMARDAAHYYNIDMPPKTVKDCHEAYLVVSSDTAMQEEKAQAAAFVRERLKEHQGKTYVAVPEESFLYHVGPSVAIRTETAYAAAALLAMGEPAERAKAIAATNYITGQFNEDGRLYSTVDTAACLALLLELREVGLVSPNEKGRVLVNGQEMSVREALAYDSKAVKTVRCLEGLIAVQVTSEVIERWSTFKGKLAVEVHLEKKGHIQEQYSVGDEVDLVIRVPRYEPGLLAHICLPDALARIVGGGQVKRFSLDFCEKNELRVPLVAVGVTALTKDTATNAVQHWAVIVRNMFQEEMIGNPGLLQVVVL